MAACTADRRAARCLLRRFLGDPRAARATQARAGRPVHARGIQRAAAEFWQRAAEPDQRTGGSTGTLTNAHRAARLDNRAAQSHGDHRWISDRRGTKMLRHCTPIALALLGLLLHVPARAQSSDPLANYYGNTFVCAGGLDGDDACHIWLEKDG